jgi:hypothetical protein
VSACVWFYDLICARIHALQLRSSWEKAQAARSDLMQQVAQQQANQYLTIIL